MQFKEQANKIQVLAYRGYNREKRRAEVKMLGSIDKFSFELSVGLLENLTVEEKSELTTYVEALRQSAEKLKQQHIISSVVNSMISADPLLAAGFVLDVRHLNADEAAAVWRVLKAASNALEDAGHAAPKRQYKRNAGDSIQSNQELPLA